MRSTASTDDNEKRSTIVIDVKGLEFLYRKGKPILSDINFSVRSGEAIAILGENGSGKSTLFYTLLGFLQKRKGDILIDNIKLSEKTAGEIRKRVGFLFQDTNDQLFLPKVLDELRFGLVNMGLSEDEISDRIKKATHILQLDEYLTKNVLQLSYGERKQIAFASIFVMNPKIYFLDEPFMSLDPYHREKLSSILESLHKKGKTLLLVSHELDQIPPFFSRAIVLHKGNIIFDGKITQLYKDEELLKKANLRVPLLSRVYKELVKKGILVDKEEYPLLVEDLVDGIVRSCYGKKRGRVEEKTKKNPE